MGLSSDLTSVAALYRGTARLWSSAAAQDPVAQVFALPRTGGDPYRRYDRLRLRGDLVAGRSGMLMSATHPTCNAILRSSDFGAVPTATAKLGLQPPSWQRSDVLVHPLDDSFASLNPPEHTALRAVVAPWFAPKAMRARREFVERVVQQQLDRLAGSDPVDLVDAFALQVPSQVICALLGLPTRDHEMFCRWGLEFSATVDGARTLRDVRRVRRLLAEMADYFTDRVTERRTQPGDDVLSALVEAVAQGQMTHAGLLATAEALLIGGFVTTSNIIGNGVVALASHPEQRDQFIADPSGADSVVEETLRWEAPAQYSVRVARADTEAAGHTITRGTPVVTLLGGANRDPQTFPRPDQFDASRSNARDHLSFAAGPHYCIGAGLARMEGAIALRALYERFPALQIAGRVRYCPSRVIRGPQHLPVISTPTTTALGRRAG